MVDIKSGNKVTPLEKSAKYNNFIITLNVAERLKYLINTELLLGINRIYLLDCSKALVWITQLSTPLLFALTIYLVAFGPSHVAQYTVCRNTYCTELMLLSISGSYLQRKKLHDLFNKLCQFDKKLNIKTESISPQPKKSVVWVLVIFISVIFEYLYVIKYMNTDVYYGWDVVNLGILIHEMEKLFFCTMLHTILVRARILKKHVAKFFNVEYNDRSNSNRKNDAFAFNVKLDLSSLHNTYELLHNTSEDLKAVMSFPMIVMFFSSGINTIMFLNYVFNENTPDTDLLFNLYTVAQSVKLTLLMMAPCYLANSTSAHVAVIRAILHDAIDCDCQSKMERRKIKAFYQMTQDNDITYVLWGLIKLDTYLPLSYSSLCTTYLVIVLQYSKFIV